MTDEELAALLHHWWGLDDGWIEGDPLGRGIDHDLNWLVILRKIRELAPDWPERDGS